MAAEQKIYLISGGVGASGEQVIKTVLAQFPEHNVKLEIRSHVRSCEKLESIISEAVENNGLVVHTLVNGKLREALGMLLQEAGVPGIDLMGPLIEYLSSALDQQPTETPGLYRQLFRSYFERVEAIDYALRHDDGVDPAGWGQAQVLLVGPSRTGKTPISMYLAVLGWRAANYPLVPGLSVPEFLMKVDSTRVIGLTVDPVRLVAHRTVRQKRLGVPISDTRYTDLEKVMEEIQEAEDLYRRRGFRKVDVTDKPIEACADEILLYIPDSE